MSYTKEVLDHYHHSKNVGSLDSKNPNVGTGMVGAPACGDVMKLQIEVKDGVIHHVAFKTFGCGSAIASASYVTELLKGKSLKEATTIRNTDIAQALSLPPVKIHCSVLAEDAVKHAVEDYLTKQKNKDGHRAEEFSTESSSLSSSTS